MKKRAKIPKIRRRWTINPRTRVKEDLKRYNRTKNKQRLREILRKARDEEET